MTGKRFAHFIFDYFKRTFAISYDSVHAIDMDYSYTGIEEIKKSQGKFHTEIDEVTYDRQSRTQRTKAFINEAMAEIKATSPELSATELKIIKAELLKQPSIKAVSDKLGKVVKLNDKIKLPVKNLNTLVSKANDIQKLFEDPKGAAMNFVQGKNRSCVVLISCEPPYFYPGTKISKQFTELSKLLLQHKIFNCDFFVPCFFSSRVNDKSIEYLNKNHYGWSFRKFNFDLPIGKKLAQFIEIDNQKKELDNTVSELFLEQCCMKFSHLNFTHRMHRQLFSKFLIRENLVRDNLVAINPSRFIQEIGQNTVRRGEELDWSDIKPNWSNFEINDGWFYNKRLLELWRDVPLEYHRHPDIDDNFDAMNYSFLKKASFNIVSETVFDYPEVFCTEKTT